MERRLSAILAADIVGYSAQMERDESGTFARVTERRRAVFEPEIARHQGRIFKLMGDGILAEFGSVVQAVECAVSIQTALEARNAAVPGDQAIRARIGINLGEVIVDGDDRYGEGVNIAARLEGLADPGGICVSEKVAREVEKKLAFGFQPMGAKRLKNIAETVEVYRVCIDRGAEALRQPIPKGVARWRLAAVGAAALLVMAAGMALWRSGPAVEGSPVLAVTPFAVNMPGLDPVPAGDQIATAVAKVLETSPALADVRTGPGAATADPLPTYVLEGSLAQGSPYPAFGFRLLDGVTGAPLWTGTREFEAAELKPERVAIGARLFSSLLGARGEILRLEAARLAPGAESVRAYHLRGLVAEMEATEAGRATAEVEWRKGLAEHPGSAQLRLDLALLAWRRAMDAPPEAAAQGVSAAWQLVTEAAALPGLTADDQWSLQYLRAILTPPMLGDFAAAEELARGVVAGMPHHPAVLADMATVLANAGRCETAIEWATKAVETEVNPPDWYRRALAWGYVCADRLDEALVIYQGLADPLHADHALALILQGKDAEARAMIAELERRDPTVAGRDLFTRGPGGRQPRAAGPTQSVSEFAEKKRNLGKPRAPVQVVDDTSKGRKVVAAKARRKQAALKGSPLDDASRDIAALETAPADPGVFEVVPDGVKLPAPAASHAPTEPAPLILRRVPVESLRRIVGVSPPVAAP